MTDPNSARGSTTRVQAVRVLVVDDDQDLGEVLAATLEAFGHPTRLARTAEQALQLALRFEPDVALLDVSLGVQCGYDVAEALRAHLPLRRCRFVALTGHTGEGARRRSEAAGFHRHLTKPVALDTLLEAVAGEAVR